MNEFDYNKEWEYEWTYVCWDDVDDEIKALIIDENTNDNKLDSKDDVLRYAVPTDEKYMNYIIYYYVFYIKYMLFFNMKK